MDMDMDGYGHESHREQKPSIPVPHFTWLSSLDLLCTLMTTAVDTAI
jgi:hypothetical protein